MRTVDFIAIGFMVVALLIIIIGEYRRKRSRKLSAAEPCSCSKELECAVTLLGERASLPEELDRVRRQRDEYLECVYRFEAQRDKWKRMFLQHVVEHNNAHYLLERALIADRQRLVAAVQTINMERAEHGKEPIKRAEELAKTDPHGHPVGIAKEFCERMLGDFKASEADLDARAELRAAEHRQGHTGRVVDHLTAALELARNHGMSVADSLVLTIDGVFSEQQESRSK